MDELEMKEILKSFAGKKILITGHTGFKGSWLTCILNELGANVVGYSLPPEGKINHFTLLGLSSTIESIEGDVRDPEKLAAVLQKFRPEFVFHLAAQPLVKKSYADPATTFSTNIIGSVNLLDAVRNCDSVRSLIYVTSDKCYENREWIWGYRENDRLGGHDPYSASKAAAEIVFSAYERSYFNQRVDLGAASVRAGNVIGGGDWAVDRIIPDCIRGIQNGETIKIRNPLATRPWQHVLEPLSGYLLLAGKLRINPKKYGGAWNFGPSSSNTKTVADVAKILTQHLGRGAVEVTGHKNDHHEANLLQLNCDKAHQLLNWSPRWDFEETLSMTANWYKAYLDGEEIIETTKKQIMNYFVELI